MNKREAARWYRERYHWHPVEVEPTTKKPVRENWNQLLDPQPDNGFFEDDRLNIGILLGDPYNLTDIDIDAPEARWAWIEYAIPTGLSFGHASKPASHHFYYSDPAARTTKYNDPCAGEGQQACLIESRCLTRDGKIGFQTIVPPSTHISGEPIEFVGGAGYPGNVEKEVIERAVRYTAAAALIGRHARKGHYHETFIAIAGALRRAEWPQADAERFLRAIYRVIWKDKADLYQAEQDVNSTYQRFDDGGDTTGLRTLANLIDEKVFRTFKHWLGLESQEAWMHNQQPAPQRKPVEWPESFPLEDLRNKVITKPRMLIEGFVQTPSITLLVAPGKVGKTVLAVQMAMSIANGLSLFDNYSTVKEGAAGLIVEWDDQQGESSLQDFLKQCRASRPGQPLDIVPRPRELPTISDPGFRPWLTRQILKRPAQFCVLDSLTALRGFGADDKSRNVVKLDAGEILMLGEIAIETKCGIVLNHHDSKTAASLDLFSRAAGTFALAACSEAQIVLGRFPTLPVNDPARIVSVRGRHMEGLQAVLLFKADTLDYDFVLEGAAATRYPDLQTLLRGFRGKDFTAKDVKDQTGWSNGKTYETLGLFTYTGILNKNAANWAWNPGWTRTLEQI